METRFIPSFHVVVKSASYMELNGSSIVYKNPNSGSGDKNFTNHFSFRVEFNYNESFTAEHRDEKFHEPSLDKMG